MAGADPRAIPGHQPGDAIHTRSDVPTICSLGQLHCTEVQIFAKVLDLRESLILFDDLLTHLKSGQSTTPIHSLSQGADCHRFLHSVPSLQIIHR